LPEPELAAIIDKDMKEYTVKVYDNGTKTWYMNGKRHREDGPAIECVDGYKAWYINNKFHREDGPAIERANGCKAWYMNDKRHREDGPAIEEADGSKEWYINGEGLTEEEFNKRTKQPKDCDGLTVTIDGVEYRLSKVK